MLDLDGYSFAGAGGSPASTGSTASGAAGMPTASAGTGGLRGSAENGPLVGDASTGLDGRVVEGTGGWSGTGGHTTTPVPPVPEGGSSSVDPPDAAAPHDALDACTPRPLYRDRDGDGYGSVLPEDQTFACPAPGWVDMPGDCHDTALDDTDPALLVHPGQLGYFGVGYPDSNQPLGVSYDYDCSGTEETDASNSPPGRVECGSAFGSCTGVGYRDGARIGNGIDSLCGSTVIDYCQVNGSFTCSSAEFVTDSPYRCR